MADMQPIGIIEIQGILYEIRMKRVTFGAALAVALRDGGSRIWTNIEFSPSPVQGGTAPISQLGYLRGITRTTLA